MSSSYTVLSQFQDGNRDRIKEENPDLKATDVTKQGGVEWKELDDEVSYLIRSRVSLSISGQAVVLERVQGGLGEFLGRYLHHCSLVS